MKNFLTSSVAATSFLLAAPKVFAAESLDPCDGKNKVLTAACAAEGLSLGAVLGFVVTIGFIVAVLIALGFLIWGGIKWITSGGDKGGVEAARNQIIAAVIGLVIVFLAFFILNLVLGLFGLSIFNLELPTLTETAGK